MARTSDAVVVARLKVLGDGHLDVAGAQVEVLREPADRCIAHQQLLICRRRNKLTGTLPQLNGSAVADVLGRVRGVPISGLRNVLCCEQGSAYQVTLAGSPMVQTVSAFGVRMCGTQTSRAARATGATGMAWTARARVAMKETKKNMVVSREIVGVYCRALDERN